jgi:RNA polymerase sigma-70 factor (ECF subfamily)
LILPLSSLGKGNAMIVTRQSLLLRAQNGDEDAWSELTTLYRPLIRSWLRRNGVAVGDLDDLCQDILLSVVKYLPSFVHSGRHGAFRAWLRRIMSDRACDFWRSHKQLVLAGDGKGATTALQQLADPASDLSSQWDREHDRYILRCLLEVAEQEFEPITLRAFQRLALDGVSGAQAAEELGLSVAAVYTAKCRVLQRIRQEAEELLNC